MGLASWIAVDWGTSRLRLWALDHADQVIGEAGSDRGMGRLSGPGDFEAALLDLAAPYLAEGHRTRVLICGMAGARQGWVEAPYASLPCAPTSGGRVRPATDDPRLDVQILPGLCQTTPADVMRGEETQIAGFLAGNPDFAGTLCLPGTHAKWVRVAAGRVLSFATTMTGELFDLLCHQSILRHSVASDWDNDVFARAVDHALAQPAQVWSALFSIRAAGLVGAAAPKPQPHLSGLLIGAELAAMTDYWQGRRVVVIGAPELTARYQQALDQASARAGAQDGVQSRAMNGVDLALRGLIAAFHQHQENTK